MYIETKENNYYVREFSKDVNEFEMVWHFDNEDRIVEILEGIGWEFQFDNCLPIKLLVGDFLKIPKNVYHRISKIGTTKLIVRIKKSNFTEI
jgi:quercetin dioxygenase-like cupin family protein